MWTEFVKGQPMSLTQIKHFWDYMGSKVIVRGKSNKEIFDSWIKQDYTLEQLIEKGLLKPETTQYTQFDLIRIPSKTTQERLIYINKILKKGFDFNKNIRVKYGNIHTVKGLTFDNVIVDETITRREDYFTQLRLKYTAYSRAINDYWTLTSNKKLTLGVR